MKITSILGIDVSKTTLDCYLHLEKKHLESVPNNEKGFRVISKWIRKHCKTSLKELLVVMEYTGIYTYNFEKYLFKNKIPYVKRPALDIKRSLGMIRGKSDKADARFISKYGWMRKDELRPMKPVEDNLIALQQLMTYRDKLVIDRASYESRIKELQEQMGNDLQTHITISTKQMIGTLSIEIKKLENAIKSLIHRYEELANTFKLVTSVVGIGFATAVHFMIATENFTRFSDVRKLICYCGVAPFKHESGTSIRGRSKVSHLANKKLKTLLTMAAICAVRFDPGLKQKYEEKVGEGKPKMSVLNIIRAKLIQRIFAVVKRQTVYERRLAA
jgi:transposase